MSFPVICHSEQRWSSWGKGGRVQSVLLLVVQNETRTRNKFSPSQKQMRGFLSEPKQVIT